MRRAFETIAIALGQATFGIMLILGVMLLLYVPVAILTPLRI